MADHNQEIKKVVLENTSSNNSLTLSDIQKDIAWAYAMETIELTLKAIDNSLFSILMDESKDFSNKEQMAIVLGYVDTSGCVKECFVGIVHVSNTSAISLLKGIEDTFTKLGLNIDRLRGQGYDGASNMKGE